MRRRKCVVVKTEQDLEAACKRMDDREREACDKFEDEIGDSEYEERARWVQQHSSPFDEGW